jgi:hypothetical protein
MTCWPRYSRLHVLLTMPACRRWRTPCWRHPRHCSKRLWRATLKACHDRFEAALCDRFVGVGANYVVANLTRHCHKSTTRWHSNCMRTHLALRQGLANVVRAIDELLAAPSGPSAELTLAAGRIGSRVNNLHAQLIASGGTQGVFDPQRDGAASQADPSASRAASDLRAPSRWVVP